MTNKNCILIILVFLLFTIRIFADDSLAWKEAKTEHFIFVYQQQDEQAAAELVTYCEEVYENVAGFFNSYPKTVRCVIRGQTDIANGMFTPMPNHLELYVRSPTGPWAGAKNKNWLKYLLTHELTHYIDLVGNKGFFYVLSLFMGEGVLPGSAGFWPMWLIEGIAVNNETNFTEGGRGREEHFLMRARAFALEHKELTLGQLEYASVYPPYDRFYLYGYLLVHYLRTQYGDDIYQKVRDRYLDFPFFGPWNALVSVTGKHQDVLLKEMYDELKEQWKDDFRLPQGKLVSPDTYGDYSLPVQVPGGYITYRTSLQKASAFVLLDKQFKEVQILFETRLYDSTSFSVSEDGKTLVFSSILTEGSNNDERSFSRLYRMDLSYKTSGKQLSVDRVMVSRITDNNRLWHPAISPDGTRCAAVQGDGSYSHLVMIDLQTGKTSVIFQMEQVNVFHPVFSPDSLKIAFELNVRGVQDLCLLDLSVPFDVHTARERFFPENAEYLFGPDSAGDFQPRFADNSTIIFSSDRDGPLGLYTWSLETKTMMRIHADPVGAAAGYITAEGLLYQTASQNGSCLRLLDSSMLRSDPAANTPAAMIPPARVWDPPESENFIDWPMFQFWIPYGSFEIGGNGISNAALGILLVNRSLLNSNAWDMALGMYLGSLQPYFELDFLISAGPVDFIFDIAHTYTLINATTPFYHEELSESLSVSIPFVDRFEHNQLDYFQMYGGIIHKYFLQDTQPFAMFNGFDPGGIASHNVLAAFGGAQYQHIRFGSSAELFHIWSFLSGIDFYIPLPVFNDTDTGAIVLGQLSYSFPGIMDLQALKIGAKTGYSTDNLVGPSRVKPRGAFRSATRTENGELLLSAEYLITLAILDAPLFGGLHLNGIGMGLFAEVLADWNVDPQLFAFERDYFVGIELTVLAGIGALTIPFKAGVSARLNMDDIQSYDISRDVSFYFFINLNGLLPGADGQNPARPKTHR